MAEIRLNVLEVQYVSGMRVAEFHFLTRGLRPEHAEYTQMPTAQANV